MIDRMRSAFRLAVLGLAALSLTPCPVGAAQFFPLDYETRHSPAALDFTPTCNAKLEGPILPGDSERLKPGVEAFMTAVKAEPSTPISGFALCLSSPGGDVAEAIKLNSVFHGWIKVVEDGDACISACAMLFMLTEPRDTINGSNPAAPGRFLHYRARLGIHAPHLQLDGGRTTYTAAEVADAYARALRTLRAIAFSQRASLEDMMRSLAAVFAWTDAKDGDARRLEDFDREQQIPKPESFTAITPDPALPLGALLAFLTVPPDQMLYVETLAQAMDWGIEIYGFAAPRALTERMLVMACMTTLYFRCATSQLLTCPLSFPHQDPSGPVGSSSWLSDDFGRDPDHDQMLRRNDTIAGLDYYKTQIWPPVRGLTKSSWTAWHTERVTQIASFHYRWSGIDQPSPLCDVYAVRRAGRLEDLRIHAHGGFPAGRLTYRTPVEIEKLQAVHMREATGKSEDDLARADSDNLKELGGHHLRLWRMLPPGRRLADLGEAAWAWLDEGKDFFEQPLGDHALTPRPLPPVFEVPSPTDSAERR